MLAWAGMVWGMAACTGEHRTARLPMVPPNYRDATVRLSSRYASVLQSIATQRVTPDTYGLGLTTDFTARLREVRDLNAEVRRLTPPACYQVVHAGLVAAAAGFDAFTQQASEAVSSSDAGRLRTAYQTRDQVTVRMNDALSRLHAISC